MKVRAAWLIMAGVVGIVWLSIAGGCTAPVFSSPTAVNTLVSLISPSVTVSPTLMMTETAVSTLTPPQDETISASPSTVQPSTTSATKPLPTLTIPPTATPSKTPLATPTAFPTATFTPATGGGPTRTPSATPGLFNRRRTPTAYPTWTDTPTLTPTITLTPTPPSAYLQIAKPGEMSKLTSPFRIEALVAPGDDGMVKIDLIGEDSRIITRQLLNNKVNIGRRFWIAPYIDFEISAAAEFARLEISVQDNDQRLIALCSVDLILLYLGEDEIFPPVSLLEPYVIWYPEEGETISGGIVWVGGLIRPVNAQPLILELIDKNGIVLGSKEIQPPFPSGEHTHARFDVGVPYTVYDTTEVRLTLRQESASRIPGTVALRSVLITIEP